MASSLLVAIALLAATAAGSASVAIPRVRVCPDDPSGGPARVGFDDSSCPERAVTDVDPQGRALWLRARVTWNGPERGPLGVRIAAMASSEVYLNGARLGANGRPAARRTDEIAGLMDAELHLPVALLRPGENLLAVRMSSHRMPFQVAMPVHTLRIGPYTGARLGMVRHYLPAMVASGALLMAAIFFMAAFALDRSETSAAWLSLTALLVVGQTAAEAMRGLVPYPYPVHAVRLVAITALAGLFSVALTGFVASRFRLARPRRWIAASAAAVLVGGVAAAPGFDSKTLAVLLIGACAALAGLAGPAARGDVGARLAGVALLVFVVLLVARPGDFLDRDFYLVVWGLMGVFFGDQALAMRRDRAARRAAQQRSGALELELLRRGVAPHFLLNTLNSLTEWVESDPRTGVRMIEALGRQLSALAAASRRELVTLADEIELVRSYLAVMSYRSDREFSLRVEPTPPGLAIPPGVLHTLAENAFSHNHYPAGGEFLLAVAANPGGVRIVFETPPSAGRRPPGGGGGDGRAYVTGRLTAAFGAAARLADGPSGEGSWRSVIDLPEAAP
jgi:hypothetical protein